ncbi:MAG: hypothetical protein AAF216_03225, partial [Pseudomonadota bacterium]
MDQAHQSQFIAGGEQPGWMRVWSERSLDVAAIAFWISTTCYLTSTILGLGPLAVVLSIAGTASCGFSWLFARAVFRPDAGHETWPLIVVGILILTGVPIHLLGQALADSGPMTTVLRMAASLHGLISSSVLFLAFLE